MSGKTRPCALYQMECCEQTCTTCEECNSPPGQVREDCSMCQFCVKMNRQKLEGALWAFLTDGLALN